MAESVILDLVNQVINIVATVSPNGMDGITFLLSFFLIFAISYAATALVPALTGKDKKAIRIIVSLAIAYFSASSPLVANAVQKVFPSIGILIIGAAAFIVTVYFIFPNQDTSKNVITYLVGPLIIGVLILILWGAITQWDTPMFEKHPEGIMIAGFLISNYDIGIALLVLGAIVFILFSTKGPGDNKRIIDKLLFDHIK